MSIMTIDDLQRILVQGAGADESIDLSGDIQDVEFEDLGYDSLAMLETAARIQQQYGVVLSDEQILELRTPRQVVDAVNSTAAGVN
ncbi:acyl carrier protein [Streptomyces gobiensis]|uniref:acyl carrier protein n=1 Tax=Streptomyces gobiensis TaxID=2875706 RepID=UPI001E2E584C|nr:acyl carrier protein [Streptomyces gobiensis]UGY92999.1 acyl carrier protein [Streptomyces gobiensis]